MASLGFPDDFKASAGVTSATESSMIPDTILRLNLEAAVKFRHKV